MDQDALPAAFALRHLTAKIGSCCRGIGLELAQSEQVKAELDFLFVSEQNLYAGECKAGRQITDKDLETCRLAAKLGIRQFYYCSMADFDESSCEQIEELRNEFVTSQIKTGITVLEGKDLLSGEARLNEP